MKALQSFWKEQSNKNLILITCDDVLWRHVTGTVRDKAFNM